jgi:sulfonate transport system permease protein
VAAKSFVEAHQVTARATSSALPLDAVAWLGRAATWLASPVLLLVLWWWLTERELVPIQILVPPYDVFDTARTMLVDGELQEAALASLFRVLAGFAIGAACGVVFGTLVAVSPRLDRYAGPLFYAFAQMPAVAWAPIAILLLGIGEEFKVAVIGLAVFVPVTIGTQEAIRTIPLRYLEVAAALALPAGLRFRRVLLPATLPRIVAGLRIGLSKGWMVLVFAELFCANVGLGHLMDVGRTQFQMDLVLTAVLVTGGLGFAMDRMLVRLERFGARKAAA